MSNTCTHKEFLNKHKLTMLKKAAQQVMDTERNDIPISLFNDNMNDFCNWQKCRYSGLIAHVRINGIVRRGHWLITRNGWAFLRGDLKLPKWVMVQDNKIVARSNDLIGVRDVYYGSEEVHTNFQYFNDFGEPVGIRPSDYFNKRQVALL